MHLQDLPSIKTAFYPADTNYIGVLVSNEGSLEMYDLRNFYGGPVVIYNQEYVQEERQWLINKEKDKICTEQAE